MRVLYFFDFVYERFILISYFNFYLQILSLNCHRTVPIPVHPIFAQLFKKSVKVDRLLCLGAFTTHSVFVSGFEWRQFAFAYIIFDDHLNFCAWFTKTVNIT
jgi:hypothetical protein